MTLEMVIFITALLFICAAISNSIMDTVDHHFNKSMFSLFKNPKIRLWWCESEGWKNKYIDRDPSKGRIKWKILGITFNKPVQICDAWHHFKMWMIIFMAAALSILITWCSNISFLNETGEFILFLGITGITWNLIFNWFYNDILLI